MTDRDAPKPVDLGAVAPTSEETDRVIAAVMSQLVAGSRPQQSASSDVIGIVADYVSPRWVGVAAAASLLIASSIVVASRRAASDETAPVDAVAMWATQEHVPSNAELLLAFQGYGGSP